MIMWPVMVMEQVWQKFDPRVVSGKLCFMND